jgi:hypothetical protein
MFYSFLENGLGGVQLIAHEKPQNGEYARFEFGGSWGFIRSPTAPATDPHVAHVLGSNKDMLELVETTWAQVLMAQQRGELNDTAEGDDGDSESGVNNCDNDS